MEKGAQSEWLESLVRSAVAARDMAREIDVARQAFGGDKLLAELESFVKEFRRYQRETE